MTAVAVQPAALAGGSAAAAERHEADVREYVFMTWVCGLDLRDAAAAIGRSLDRTRTYRNELRGNPALLADELSRYYSDEAVQEVVARNQRAGDGEPGEEQ